jgi:hypothetical protein
MILKVGFQRLINWISKKPINQHQEKQKLDQGNLTLEKRLMNLRPGSEKMLIDINHRYADIYNRNKSSN